MQWHPIVAKLLRPLVESHYEVRTGQPVGDLPRTSDVVLLHKTSAGPPPFRGLWKRLTPWTVLEYKGPTVSPRFDELHDLLELGLGIHRRLNELQARKKPPEPELDCPEVSFWYLVNHLGQRFLADVPEYLPGIQQAAGGIWRASVFRHPVLLVSVQELAVERDSVALHVLAGVNDEVKGTLQEVLKAEPALWASYGPWLALREPALWQEMALMAAQQGITDPLDITRFCQWLVQTGNVALTRQFIEAVGLKELVEAAGVKQVVETLGVEQLLAALSPQQREELLRLAQRDRPGETSGAP